MRIMRLLQWLIVGTSLSLLALSLVLHYRIDARFNFRAPPAPSPTASEGTIRVKKFGLEHFIIKVFDTRDEAERICGRDNVLRWEEVTSTESKDGRYSCRSAADVQ
jgi:hypothetical protein